jgi:hypothetical protein
MIWAVHPAVLTVTAVSVDIFFLLHDRNGFGLGSWPGPGSDTPNGGSTVRLYRIDVHYIRFKFLKTTDKPLNLECLLEDCKRALFVFSFVRKTN